MVDKKLVKVKTNNLTKWLVSKSCFYTYRTKNGDRYDSYFVDCELFRELILLYETLSPEERSMYIEKHTQKATA